MEDNFLSCLKFWRQSEQNRDRESAAKENAQNGRYDVTISKFQNQRKTDLTNICQIICRKFHQNRFIRLGCSAVTHIHTYIHTPSVRSKHIQSKWLNIKTNWHLLIAHSWEGQTGCVTPQRQVCAGGHGSAERETKPCPGTDGCPCQMLTSYC